MDKVQDSLSDCVLFQVPIFSENLVMFISWFNFITVYDCARVLLFPFLCDECCFYIVM